MSKGPEQAPYHVSIIETTERRRGFPPPAQVARAALAEIQPDGSVFHDYDDEAGKLVFYEPEEPVDLDNLAPDTYAKRLYSVAWAIRGTVLHAERSGSIEGAQSDIRILAHHLSRYRHNPAFVDYAASLLQIDDHGALHGPTLPKASPWEWVPQLRADLASVDHGC